MWASLSSPLILRTHRPDRVDSVILGLSLPRRCAGRFLVRAGLQARDDLLSVGAKRFVTPHHILYAPDGA